MRTWESTGPVVLPGHRKRIPPDETESLSYSGFKKREGGFQKQDWAQASSPRFGYDSFQCGGWLGMGLLPTCLPGARRWIPCPSSRAALPAHRPAGFIGSIRWQLCSLTSTRANSGLCCKYWSVKVNTIHFLELSTSPVYKVVPRQTWQAKPSCPHHPTDSHLFIACGLGLVFRPIP